MKDTPTSGLKSVSAGSELKTCKVFVFLVEVVVLVVGFDWTVGELFVEVGNVGIGCQDGDEGSFDWSRHQGVPVYLLEPGVVLYLLGTAGPQPVLRVFL